MNARVVESASSRLGIAAVGWIAFACATTRWMEWGEPIRRGYATDELQYESIARAAPGFPHAPVSAAASQRFTAHWVVGVIADATHLGLHTVYRVTAFACLAAIAFVVIRLVLASGLPEAAGVVALGLVITNPYAWRLPLIAPAMLSDGLLALGVGVGLLGLIEEEPWLAVAGCLIAVLGRETGLIPAVGVCVWLAVRRRRWPAFCALALPIALFAAVKTLGERFSLPDPSASGFTVVSPLLHLPGTARELADHFGRVVLASPSSLAILAAGLVALGLKGRLRAAGMPLTASLLLAALVVLQPAAFNPAWVQHNESRLAALGIVPLALASAAALASTRAVASRAATILVITGIALASLHHRYTWGGIIESGRIFVAVEAVVAVALFMIVLTAGTFDSRREMGVAPDVDSLA